MIMIITAQIISSNDSCNNDQRDSNDNTNNITPPPARRRRPDRARRPCSAGARGWLSVSSLHYVYIYIYTHVFSYLCLSLSIYIYMIMYDIYIYIYTHTYTHMCSLHPCCFNGFPSMEHPLCSKRCGEDLHGRRTIRVVSCDATVYSRSEGFPLTRSLSEL